ncbi:hypothetical protein [Streptomyces sp. NPDC002580]|uniref:hypothetical protein n=1 Tax=Streptomyces sp. NPDC002580 TaxID=3364653 RepID=UPI0036A54699
MPDDFEGHSALRGADGTAEVLASDDAERVHRPEAGERDATLLEVGQAIAPVGRADVTALPLGQVGHQLAGEPRRVRFMRIIIALGNGAGASRVAGLRAGT